MTYSDLLLFIQPFAPPDQWLQRVRQANPGIRVEYHHVEMYAKELPPISKETWAEATILFTWQLFPPKEWVPKLQYIQLLSAGCNQLLGMPLFEDTDIAFCTSNGNHPPQIAEWVFSTFLAFQHHIPEYLENQRACKWVDPPTDEDTEDAVGLRIGILGYGCIGRQCARVAKAFGMDVYAYTLHSRDTPESRRSEDYTEPGLGDPEGEFPSAWFAGKEQLNEFLASDLDLLLITLPLTNQTRGMISREQFDILSKRKAYVSNVGRGPCINTEDLMAALDEGKIRGAALDVTDPEPLPADHKLWGYKNVIITPHCSGNSNHYYERVLKIFAYNLERRVQGKPLVNHVNRALGY
ncbi:D-isomer specific 2-hydroxyacid dehydrogenase family protein [Aspergillus tubingensis]|uniref:D-isomer specific 2-hydroxyacid dehydrogenase family protein n=1 Tax=Aspergillus tubingensis TaxID=5068 RepID=UPI0015786E2C|nr:D-isomer specific 2-hydroxyacid dehydrogenase [Aspergillus tubingensis]GFN13488.1 D-isomer specific 2-hydroxyacid dehydrogenase [Aspergillus tubingensis]